MRGVLPIEVGIQGRFGIGPQPEIVDSGPDLFGPFALVVSEKPEVRTGFAGLLLLADVVRCFMVGAPW